MSHSMKNILLVLRIIAIALLMVSMPSLGQEPQQGQKTIIQTPFGPKEVEGPAPGAPQQPAQQPAVQQPQAAPFPAAPQTPPPPEARPPAPAQAPAAPAAQQGDEAAPISLHLD